MDLKKNLPYIIMLVVGLSVCISLGVKFLGQAKDDISTDQTASNSFQDQSGVILMVNRIIQPKAGELLAMVNLGVTLNLSMA